MNARRAMRTFHELNTLFFAGIDSYSGIVVSAASFAQVEDSSCSPYLVLDKRLFNSPTANSWFASFSLPIFD